MPNARLFCRFGVLSLAVLLLSTCACAQSPIDAGALPGRTMFYLQWHGTPAGESRKNSSLFALWDDPQFATARTSLVDSLMSNARNQKPNTTLRREEFEEYVKLLDNPFVIGYLRRPESHSPAKATAEKETAAPTWNGMFFIYDRSGKEQLLSKAVLRMRGAEKDIPKLTELTVAGVPSLKVGRKDGVTYWAEFGKFAASANELPVFEEILNVLNGKGAGGTLSQSAAYQEAKPLLSGGVLEFFLGIPSAEQIALSTPDKSAAQLRVLLSTLKVDSVHCVAGRISLEGTRTRMSGAVLGDTAPGGLFDIFADGQANPVSIGYLNPETIYYGESQFNLLGIYHTLKRAFTSPGSSQKQVTSPLEQMAETRLGMPLPEALGLVSGEVAWFQNSPTLDDTQKVYLLGIHDKPNALKLTRTLMGDQISSERTEGNATYLKISLRGGQGTAGVAQWNFYHLAMTPNALFGSSKSDTLHQYITRSPAVPDATHFKSLMAARTMFPEKLNGFSYFDFQKLDWAGLQKKWVAQANKAALTAQSTDATNSNKKLTDWLIQVDPEVFSRHLHTLTGASWKDAKGVHFDEWLD